jgi:hypothetical protein
VAELATDGLAGAGTGALIGLTDGMSLLGGIAARSVVSAGIEVGREAITSEINGVSSFRTGILQELLLVAYLEILLERALQAERLLMRWSNRDIYFLRGILVRTARLLAVL